MKTVTTQIELLNVIESVLEQLNESNVHNPSARTLIGVVTDVAEWAIGTINRNNRTFIADMDNYTLLALLKEFELMTSVLSEIPHEFQPLASDVSIALFGARDDLNNAVLKRMQ